MYCLLSIMNVVGSRLRQPGREFEQLPMSERYTRSQVFTPENTRFPAVVSVPALIEYRRLTAPLLFLRHGVPCDQDVAMARQSY